MTTARTCLVVGRADGRDEDHLEQFEARPGESDDALARRARTQFRWNNRQYAAERSTVYVNQIIVADNVKVVDSYYGI